MGPAAVDLSRSDTRRVTLLTLLAVLLALIGLVAMHAVAAFAPEPAASTTISSGVADPPSGTVAAGTASAVGATGGAGGAGAPWMRLEDCAESGISTCLLIGTLCALGILAVFLAALPLVRSSWPAGPPLLPRIRELVHRIGSASASGGPSLVALGVSRT